MNNHCLIFDLDGVLVDSEILSARGLIEMLAEYGVSIDLLYVRRNFIGKRFAFVLDTILSEFKCDLPPSFERDYLERLGRSFAQDLKKTQGISQILGQLTAAHCIATSSTRNRAANTLGLTGLDGVFEDRVFTGDQVLNGKPAPDLFLLAAEQMGFAPHDCTVVEDSVAGLTAALAAGMRCYRYVGASHLKGLEPVAFPPAGVTANFDQWTEFPALCPELFR